MTPSHYLNRCWNIFNWTPGNKLQWNFSCNSKLFIHEKCISKYRLPNGDHFVQGRWVDIKFTFPRIICKVFQARQLIHFGAVAEPLASRMVVHFLVDSTKQQLVCKFGMMEKNVLLIFWAFLLTCLTIKLIWYSFLSTSPILHQVLYIAIFHNFYSF